jgi:hypothetical protein
MITRLCARWMLSRDSHRSACWDDMATSKTGHRHRAKIAKTDRADEQFCNITKEKRTSPENLPLRNNSPSVHSSKQLDCGHKLQRAVLHLVLFCTATALALMSQLPVGHHQAASGLTLFIYLRQQSKDTSFLPFTKLIIVFRWLSNRLLKMTPHAKDFLSSPGPPVSVERIDFKKAGLDRYDGLYAVILDNVLTPTECEQLRFAAEGSTKNGWERAMVNLGGGKQRLMEDSRNCGRIIYDSPEMVEKIWKRIGHLPVVQEIVRLEKVPRIFGNGPVMRKEVWKFSRPNERMRFLKYQGGEYFRPHCGK